MLMFTRGTQGHLGFSSSRRESYSGRIQQPHMEDIGGNYSTVVETLIQAMQYVHRKSHSVHLKGDGGCMNAGKQGLG